MTAVEQLAEAITRVRHANRTGHTMVALEVVCLAAETLMDLMGSPATIEWCDHHGRPHEFCELIDARECDPRVRTVGPEVGLWTT